VEENTTYCAQMTVESIQATYIVYKYIFAVNRLKLTKKQSNFCRFCVVICFFHPRQNGQCPPTSKDFYTRNEILSI